MTRKPRKTAKQKAAEDDAITRVQAEAHLEAATSGQSGKKKNSYASQYGRVAYESFILQNGWKVGQKISDASGVHRIPSWDQHTTFVKDRWHVVAQAVIDAATKKPA